jgi:exodeoxyribonuclease-1
MTRALRPEGIKWPFDLSGKPTNRLELLTGVNKLNHDQVHDALSDVTATIEMARLIRNKQTKLFEYLFSMRDKKKVAALVNKSQPFVYTSGKYASEFDKTTVAVKVCDHPKNAGALVFDLRHDPAEWVGLTVEQLAKAWPYKKDSDEPRLPVKTLQFNRCPAVAPLGVLDDASQARLKLDLKQITRHLNALKQAKDLADKLCQAIEILDNRQQTRLVSTDEDVDGSIYDGFFSTADKQTMRVVRVAEPQELSNLGLTFEDHRLPALLPLYKARNCPKQLTSEEREAWDKVRATKFLQGGQNSKLAKYFKRLQEVVDAGGLTGHQQYLVEELRLYAESIAPELDS